MPAKTSTWFLIFVWLSHFVELQMYDLRSLAECEWLLQGSRERYGFGLCVCWSECFTVWHAISIWMVQHYGFCRAMLWADEGEFEQKLVIFSVVLLLNVCAIKGCTWRIYIWRYPYEVVIYVCFLHHHHHHHLSLHPLVGFHPFSQVAPSSSIFSCFLPVYTFNFFNL
jgi:hypothetical protein